ncbi:hypothetical protein QCA50_012565 [Cerrena zonata]|uniref:Uncharacterized protein n=1 Tax=Cerrena zonata TaxID=2478898 RepID=A0AAW0G3L7_9APHY
MSLYTTQQPYSSLVHRYAFTTCWGLVVSNINKPVPYPKSHHTHHQNGRHLLHEHHFPEKLYLTPGPESSYQLRPSWGRDDYFYMAFVPRKLDCLGDSLFDPLDWRHPFTPALLAQWQELETTLHSLARVLQPILPFIPLDTRLPPLPSVCGYIQYFTDPNSQRNQSRRFTAQRLLFAWACWLSFVISLGLREKDGRPLWLGLLQQSTLDRVLIDSSGAAWSSTCLPIGAC